MGVLVFLGKTPTAPPPETIQRDQNGAMAKTSLAAAKIIGPVDDEAVPGDMLWGQAAPEGR